MADYPKMVITDLGKALYAKVQAGAQLEYTRMKIGSGQYNGDPTKLTDLIQPIDWVPINGFVRTGTTAQIKGIFENKNITQSTYSCELGVFAQDPDLGEVLYGYTNAGSQGDYIPPISSGPHSSEYQINVTVDNVTNVTVQIPSTGYLPLSDVATNGPNKVPRLNSNGVGVFSINGDAQTVGGRSVADMDARYETPSGAQAKVKAHADLTTAHGSTAEATPNRIVMRDANGRAKVSAPSAPDDIARKAEVDAVNTAQANTQTSLNNHIADNVRHITAAERQTWNGKLDKSGGKMTGNLEMNNARLFFTGPANFNTFYNLAAVSSNGSKAGAIVINTPFTSTLNYELIVEIDGYFFANNDTAFKLILGFYNGSTFLSPGYLLIGARRLQVRLARDASGKTVIILGDKTDSFSDAQISVSKVAVTYGLGTNLTLGDGWTISIGVTDLTPYTSVITVPDKTGFALKSEFDAHVGSGGAAHALATSGVAGFMSAADKAKLDGLTPTRCANGNWSDRTTSITAGGTFTKTIPLGFAAKRGRFYTVNPSNSGSICSFTTTGSDAIFFTWDKTSGVSSTANQGSSAPGWRAFGSNIRVSECYISGNNLVIKFTNTDTKENTLNIGLLAWEAEG
ncbi:hypothetical protein [Brevibacillus panacihumi]|uniref:hypothetical protein n=1 Tax=Brevibacillus panacihumi TaxID=497735 RepID=UPI003D25043D